MYLTILCMYVCFRLRRGVQDIFREVKAERLSSLHIVLREVESLSRCLLLLDRYIHTIEVILSIHPAPEASGHCLYWDYI